MIGKIRYLNLNPILKTVKRLVKPSKTVRNREKIVRGIACSLEAVMTTRTEVSAGWITGEKRAPRKPQGRVRTPVVTGPGRDVVINARTPERTVHAKGFGT